MIVSADSLGGLGVVVGEVPRWPGMPAMFTAADGDGNHVETVE